MFNNKEEAKSNDVQKQAIQMFDEVATKLDEMELYEFCQVFKDTFIKYREAEICELEAKREVLVETLTAFKEK